MPLPYSQNFDGSTSIPSGWDAVGTTWTVVGAPYPVGAAPTTTPNMVKITDGSGSGAYLSYATSDGNGGDVTVQADVNNYSSNNGGRTGVFCRGSMAAQDDSGDCYTGWYDTGINRAGITRHSGGTATDLAWINPTTAPAAKAWLTVALTASGSSLSLSLHDQSSGKYLQSDGSWSAASGSAVTATDGAITGAGTSGLYSLSSSGVYTGFSDTFSLSVALTPTTAGTMAATEGRDVAAFVGYTPVSRGTMSATDGRDRAVLVGLTYPKAILSVQEAPDAATFAGNFASVATMAAVEAPDVAAIFGAIKAGSMAATERGDAAAFVGLSIAAGTIGATERRDTASISATAFKPTSLAATEARDVAAFVGVVPSPRYNVYRNDGAGGPIDYSTVVDATVNTTWTSGTLQPGIHRIAIRAQNRYGEEQNLDCYVEVIIGPDGTDVTNRPSPPIGMRAFPVAGARIKVEWGAPILSGPNAPTAFNVYITPGTTVVYGTPATTVPASSGLMGAYSVTLNGTDGQQYAIGVRAVNDTGEEPNESFVVCVADGTGPTAVLNLTGTATV